MYIVEPAKSQIDRNGQTDRVEPWVETWRIASRLNLYLWNALDDAQRVASAAKGKSVFAHFAHLHAVRLMWLKSAAPAMMEGLTKVDTADQVASALEASGRAVERLLAGLDSPEGRIRGFKPHAAAFLGYLIAHEAYHRGQVDLVLRLSGMPLDDETHYGLWEWGVR